MGLKNCRAGHHLDDCPGLTAIKFDVIPNGRLTFDQQNDTRDEIRRDLLQAETEPDANRTAFAKFAVVAVTGLVMNQVIVSIFAAQAWPYWLALGVIYVTVPAGTFVALRFWALK